MHEAASHQPELPDILALLSHVFSNNVFLKLAFVWEYVVYSLVIVAFLLVLTWILQKNLSFIPRNRLQTAVELLVSGLDGFATEMLGSKGRKYLPFIGTLFVYIFFMNVAGLIPFMKSATASWSTTMALAICVFFYVQYSAIKDLGFLKYIDHMAGNPRGGIAYTAILPIFMFLLHTIAELAKPLSLSLRLRSNIWGDDVLLAVLTSFGLKGLPLLFLNIITVTLTALIQAVVFSLLTMIYFAIFLNTDEQHH